MDKLYEESSIQSIADAIREKNGETTTYKVSEMAQAIKDIPSGGGSEYVYLDYIEGSGSSYIKTNLPSGTNECVHSVIFEIVTAGTTQFIVGANPTVSTNKYGFFITGSGVLNLQNGANTRWSKVLSVGTKYSATVTKNCYVIADVDSTTFEFTDTFNHPDLYLFCASDDQRRCFKGRIYSYVVTAPTVSYIFRPAKRISDGAIGMHELNTNTFFASATSTPFIAGSVAN